MDSTFDNVIWYEDAQLIRTDIDEETILTKKIDEVFSGYQFIRDVFKVDSTELEDNFLTESKKSGDDARNFDFLNDFPRYNIYRDPKKLTNEHLKMKGYVTSIGESSFEGRLVNQKGTYEVVEFENDDVSEEDLPLFKEGAVFYWIFGLFTINKTRKKVSEIRFQRIAPLNPNEFTDLIDQADELNDTINWD